MTPEQRQQKPTWEEFRKAIDLMLSEGCLRCRHRESLGPLWNHRAFQCHGGQFVGTVLSNPKMSWCASRGYPKLLSTLESCDHFEPKNPWDEAVHLYERRA